MEISKADWKLFRERIADWQEAYMDRLNQEYISLLIDSQKGASDKFWKLEERISRDKKTPGVQLELRKSEVLWDLAALLNDHAIRIADLDGFSNELVETVKRLAGINSID